MAHSMHAWLVAISIAPVVCPAQSPRLVADLNSRLLPSPASPRPGEGSDRRSNAKFVTVVTTSYFVADTPGVGAELFETKGTPATTGLTLDIHPGAPGSAPKHLTAAGTLLYFSADNGLHGRELWVADPLRQQVRMVTDLNPGPASYDANPTHMIAYGTSVLFQACAVADNAELWSSDGTAAGTRLVKEIAPGLDGSWPHQFTQVGNVVYFRASDGATKGLWCTDGTTTGTRLIRASTFDFDVGEMAEFNGQLYFVAFDPGSGIELWRTDGTVAGTTLVHDVNAGPGDSLPTNLIVFGGALYFTADGTDPANPHDPIGTELFKTDGRNLVALDLRSGHLSSDPKLPIVVGSGANAVLYLVADGDQVGNTSATTGREIWRIDATGGRPIDLIRGAAGSRPYALTGGPGDALYFAADSDMGTDLYRSDGSLAGTRIVKQINPYPDPGGAAPAFLTHLPSGSLLLSADDGVHGIEPWISDGTASGTRLLADLNPASGVTRASYPRIRATLGEWVYFTADAGDAASRDRLWMSAGSAALTRLVPGLAKAGALVTGPVLGHGNRLYVVAAGVDASNRPTGSELWVVDQGTGTTRVLDIRAGSEGSDPDELTAYQGRVYFTAAGTSPPRAPAPPGRQLWVTDGTPSGTHLIADIDPRAPTPGNASVDHACLTPYNGEIYFANSDPAHGRELWATDGTTGGTRMVFDIAPGVASSGIQNLAILDDHLLFVACSPAHGGELWVTDGTPTGTRVIELASGPQDAFVNVLRGEDYPLVVVGGFAFFRAVGDLNRGVAPAAGEELWRTDGTAAGTTMVADIAPGAAGSRPGAIQPMGYDGSIMFVADDTNHASRYHPGLWTSDGTPQRTRFIQGLSPAWSIDRASPAARVGGRHYLIQTPVWQRPNILGYELVLTDGTAQGTRSIADRVMAGSTPDARVFTPPAGGRIYFVRDDGQHGDELWVIDDLAFAHPVGTGCAPGVSPTLAASDPVLFPVSAGTVNTELSRGALLAPGILVVGQWRPVAYEFFSGCLFHVDLGGPQVYLPFVTDALGRWRGALSMQGAISGYRYAMQAGLSTSRTTSGIEFTNGVVLAAGR